MSRLAVVLLALVSACTSFDPHDVTGPFTGTTQRYAVDTITMPPTRADAMMIAEDLDRDGRVDNAFGNVVALLAGQGDVTTHGPDMIAAGSIASIVEIQADDFVNDGTVAAWYDGADGDPTSPVGGMLVDGTFTSNRTAITHVPGRARVRLPVFVDTDPTVLDLRAMELDLSPDGRGGLNGVVRGGLDPDEALEVAYQGVLAMFDAQPRDHLTFWFFLDTDRDGTITRAEFAAFTGSLLAPDIELDGHKLLSVAFAIHLGACPGGVCPTAPIADRCHDRIRDGAETDVDCGDGCLACAAATACAVPGDCQSGSCVGGSCAPPTCTDGVLDGFESDVDCGGACAQCVSHQVCTFWSDCVSNYCQGTHCY